MYLIYLKSRLLFNDITAQYLEWGFRLCRQYVEGGAGGLMVDSEVVTALIQQLVEHEASMLS